MPSHVLVGYDGSPLARQALEYALENHPEASITTLTVVDPIDAVYRAEAGGRPETSAWVAAAEERADETRAEARETAAEHGAEITAEVEFGRPHREIVSAAAERDADLVLVGTHGRASDDPVVLGSVAERVVRRADAPVLVVR